MVQKITFQASIFFPKVRPFLTKTLLLSSLKTTKLCEGTQQSGANPWPKRCFFKRWPDYLEICLVSGFHCLCKAGFSERLQLQTTLISSILGCAIMLATFAPEHCLLLYLCHSQFTASLCSPVMVPAFFFVQRNRTHKVYNKISTPSEQDRTRVDSFAH